MLRHSCAGLRRSAMRATESIRLRPDMAPALVGGVVGVVIGRRLRRRPAPEACPSRDPGLLRRLARMTGNLIFGSMLSHVAHAVSSRHSDNPLSGRAVE